MASEPHPYLDLVNARAGAATREWLKERLATVDEKSAAPAFVGAGRRLGTEAVTASASERDALERSGQVVPSGWPLARLGRIAILFAAVGRTAPANRVTLVETLFRRGDNAEREAILHALSSLPEPERFASLAIDACRSHVQSVFEAIACENAYPAQHFPDESFNQMVLKAFFTEVAVSRIEGLERRLNSELSRMAEGYADERRAAGRSVPPDLHLVTRASPQ